MNVSFVARPRDGGPSYEGLDISFGGMMCRGGSLIWPGNILPLDLILPGEHKPLRIMGRVVELVSYRDEVAMRIRFEEIGMPERKRIALWMSRRSQS